MSDEEQVKYIQVSELRLGSYIIINDGACIITAMSKSKTGKHGSSKAHITAKNIFTHKKVETLMMCSENARVPVVTRMSYDVLDLGDDDSISLLNSKMEEVPNLVKMDSDEPCLKLKKAMEEGKTMQVTVITALGITKICDCSESKD
jgi:translation initiation factor 5A